MKATARSAEKAEEWISLFPAHKANYQYVVVEDIAAPNAFDEAVKGCDIIAHLASPAHWNQNVRFRQIPTQMQRLIIVFVFRTTRMTY